jgi:hypothetical protein
MNSTANELVSDPLFQLNAILWLAQPLPVESNIIPLLHRQGFAVYAIAPLLSMPLDVRLIADRQKVSMQVGVRPDVVLENPADRKFCICECKANSFGPDSSTAAQARALLVTAGPRAAEILGLATSEPLVALLDFVVPEPCRPGMTETISVLQTQLRTGGISTGACSAVGLLAADEGISIVVDVRAAEYFGLSVGQNLVLRTEPGNDPRPLYLIPYDPDVEQSANEAAYCKRVLFERVHSSIVAAVGRAQAPCELCFKSHDLLNDATFGMFEHWENRESERHMRSICRHFMGALVKAANSAVPDSAFFEPGNAWKVSLRSQQHSEKLMDAITRFSCETLDLQAEPPPTLFDDLPDTRDDLSQN